MKVNLNSMRCKPDSTLLILTLINHETNKMIKELFVWYSHRVCHQAFHIISFDDKFHYNPHQLGSGEKIFKIIFQIC